MKSIGDLVQRFKNWQPSDYKVREKIIEVIKNKTNIVLDLKQVEVKGMVVRLKVNSSTKTIILIKKNLILDELSSFLGDKTPLDLI